MNCRWIVCLSVFRTCGTLMFRDRALVRIFASDFVLLFLICSSSCLWRYPFGILSFTILFFDRKIFASAPWEISFIVYFLV